MKMDKTNRSDLHRLFLFENLPEPLTRASSHLQIFDNYIRDTRIRLRSVRVPETREWTWVLQQRFPEHEGDLMRWKIAEIYLNESEFHIFERFQGREIRKNRYFHEYDGKQFAFDMFLGPLWGLNLARVEFESAEEMSAFEPPPFTMIEVSNTPLFLGENLVDKNFEEVREVFGRISSIHPLPVEIPDE
jgi:CYTH domain-containing protein